MRFGGASSSQQLTAAPKQGARTGLPLEPCPTCGEEILELTCGERSKVPGAIFFKCQLHERDDPSSCPWILFAEKYVRKLIGEGKIQKNSHVVRKLIEQGIINRGVVASKGPEESLPAVDEMRIAIEANSSELVPLLDDLMSLKNVVVRVEEKL